MIIDTRYTGKLKPGKLVRTQIISKENGLINNVINYPPDIVALTVNAEVFALGTRTFKADAIFDTGATLSAISKRLADALNAEVKETTVVNRATVKKEVQLVDINASIDGTRFFKSRACILENLSDVDLIIGMDIIKQFSSFALEKTEKGYALGITY